MREILYACNLSAACCLGSGATHSRASFTLETLSSTSYGVTSPTTTTFLLSKSTSNDVTPAQKDTQQGCNNWETFVSFFLFTLFLRL